MFWTDLTLYAASLAALAMTPGPVVFAVVARSAARGLGASVPLCLGVAIGDVVWPLAAIFGLAAIVEVNAGAMDLLRWGGALVLIWMGVSLIRNRGGRRGADARLAESGWAGFVAGLLAIAGNPKAALFYVGMLPAIFDIGTLDTGQIVLICVASVVVPLLGNLGWGTLAARARRWLRSPSAMSRLDMGSGLALIGVAAVIVAS